MSISRSPVREAFTKLKDSGICELLEASCVPKRGMYVFRCKIPVVQPNDHGLPETVTLLGAVPESFPYGEITFFPEDETVRGFPHQEADTGKLCLPPFSLAPLDSSRLTTSVGWAKEWLTDAAKGTLLKPGDPYELPDFRNGLAGSLVGDFAVLHIDEDTESYQVWRDNDASYGLCEVVRSGSSIVPMSYISASGERIRATRFTNGTFSGTTFKTAWMRLPDVVFERHRPPRTFAELREVCHAARVSLRRVIKLAWDHCPSGSQFGLFMIGFPIPKIFGGPVVELHWQPVFFRSPKRLRRELKSNTNKLAIWDSAYDKQEFGATQRIAWGATTNLSHDRAIARGSLPASLTGANVAVVGVGALGSCVADLLFRGGVRSMSLFDGDSVEYGNLCRHELDGRDVGDNKARALARRLQSCNPISAIRGFDLKIPTHLKLAPESQQSLEAADLVVDCSTDNGAFNWLSTLARKEKHRLVSAFVNPHATIITLLFSGKHANCERVQKMLMKDIAERATPLDPASYFGAGEKNDLVVPGAGCWHPTFPATHVDLHLLAAAAAKHIAAWFVDGYSSHGVGLILRRQEASEDALVETVWREQYR